jgi:hypothetical protein
MTDDLHTAAIESPPDPASRFRFGKAFRAIGASIFINAVVPYLIYRALEPQFPQGSINPLLASTVFPLLALVFGLAIRRSLDYVAIISLTEILISIIVVVVARDVRLALVARALQGTLTGLFFLATVAINRPLLFYVARQFVAANSPQSSMEFERANRVDQGKTFSRLTTLWGAGTILVSLVNIALAATVAPANYLLISPILNIGVNVIMIVFTVRYSTVRFTRAARR